MVTGQYRCYWDLPGKRSAVAVVVVFAAADVAG